MFHLLGVCVSSLVHILTASTCGVAITHYMCARIPILIPSHALSNNKGQQALIARFFDEMVLFNRSRCDRRMMHS